MMIKTNKLGAMAISALAAASLAFAGVAPAFAITADEAANQDITWNRAADNAGNTQYWLEISEDGWGDPDKPGGLDNMSVDVPIKVNLAVDAEGNFVTPTALKNVIENKSEFPLDVTAMSLTAKNGFTNVAATGFANSLSPNVFKGAISSTSLNTDRSAVAGVKQSIAFTKLDQLTQNQAWRMAASDNSDRYGSDCLFIQIEGALNNVTGKYFTAPINVFDITYTFAAASADVPAPGASITD